LPGLEAGRHVDSSVGGSSVACGAVRAGATHRKAAERFAVSAASVSRWQRLERERGDVRPKALGGDRRSGRIDAHKAAILNALGSDGDRTIEEVRHVLKEQGLAFSFGALQRFFRRHATTRKKDRACRRAGPA
jgi:transposase